MFTGDAGNDFHLCALRVKASLRGRDLVVALDDGEVDGTITKKALSIIILTVGDIPLRSIQNTITARLHGTNFSKDMLATL